jgi:hypothetical protein
VLLILLAALLRRERPAPIGAPGAALLRHAVVAAVFFVLIWPAIFRFSIYPRYVYAGVALVLVVLLFALELGWSAASAGASRSSRRLALVALLVPAALADLPRQVAFMVRFGAAPRQRLFEEGPPEWRLGRDLEIVNQHRLRMSPGAGYFERTTLLDMEGTYLLDSAGFRLWSRELAYLQATLGERAGVACPWRLLSRLDVAYLRTRFRFELWPEPYRHVAGQLPALDASGRVRYLEPGRLRSLLASEPACSGE